MKHGLLAAAFLLTSAGFVSADYVIIVANVGAEKELQTPGFGMAGMRGGMAGMRGGMAGMRGGMAGMRGGMAGMRGGMAGMAGARPGMGLPGGSPSGMPNSGAAPPGMPNPGMAPPGMPNPGAPQPGMGAMGGMRGGMMGMRGGMMMGMPGGMMGGMMGGMGGTPDADDNPYFVIAVVEVKPRKIPIPGIKSMADLNKVNLPDEQLALLPPMQVGLPDRLGKTCYLLKKPSFGELFILTEGKDKALPTVAQRYQAEFDKTMKGTPSAGDLLRLAGWTLEHGLVEEFPKIMKKLVEVDKTNAAAVAYLKIKADLDRAASNDASVASWQGKLLSGYKTIETPHYLIVHNAREENAVEVKTHVEHLENAFRSFYFWFALHRMTLPVPRTRQVIVLTRSQSDFDKLNKVLNSGPVVVDGFFARRENLLVMTSQRQDDTYEALKTYWKTWEDKGFKRDEILQSKTKMPPKTSVPPIVLLEFAAGQANKLAEAQMLALMLKALEQEGELATVSHETSRQLLFGSGLLPRNVAVPEWILFGMGSFFETPLQSPWPTVGAPSPYFLPRWRDLQKSGLGKSRVQVLRRVVTDGFFRSVPPDGKSDSPLHRLHEAALRKARTVSWSLTYFLAQQKLEGLRRYFTELSKMPRDIELDDTILLDCFARAFGCVDGNNKVDEAKLSALASEWYSYLQRVNFESEGTMKDIREKIAKKVKEMQEQAQTQQSNENQGQPGAFPGVPGGYPPGAPGIPPNGRQPGRNMAPKNPVPNGVPQPRRQPSQPQPRRR